MASRSISTRLLSPAGTRSLLSSARPTRAILASSAPSSPLARVQQTSISPSRPQFARLAHTIPRPRPQPSNNNNNNNNNSKSHTPSESTSPAAESESASASERVSRTPHYEMTFTCVPCGARSQHKVSKQGYHHGSVLVTCPGCRNRHVISDHLGIFGDRRGVTVEDLLRERGQLVKRGTLGEDGDVEFWEDGTTTVRRVVGGEEEGEEEAGGVDEDADRDAQAPGASFVRAAGSRTDST